MSYRVKVALLTVAFLVTLGCVIVFGVAFNNIVKTIERLAATTERLAKTAERIAVTAERIEQPRYDYAIMAPPDDRLQAALDLAGYGGGTIVSARRTVTDEEPRYELIIKTPQKSLK